MVMEPEASQPAESNRSSLANLIGVVSALIGILFALVTLSTTPLKIVGALTCAAVGLVVWQAAHDRAHGRLSNALVWRLAATGVMVLTLVVMLGTQTGSRAGKEQGKSGDTQGQAETDRPDTTGPTSTPTPDTTATTSATPSPVWLATLEPVEGGDAWDPGVGEIDTKPYPNSVIIGTCFDAHQSASFDLGKNYSRFVATVGLSSDAPEKAKFRIAVAADGEPVTSGVASLRSQSRIDIPVSGVLRLTLSVEDIGGISACDKRNIVLGDAQLIP